MKSLLRVLSVSLAVLFFFSSTASAEIQGEKKDETLSPYFLVKSDDPEVDKLPLKSTSADVNIAGVIADVVVTQEYKNEGKNALEAIYVFPGSTRAAVYGMKMTIGERTIVAKIDERAKARAAYEAAKQAGKSASLLEQQRPNVFQMNVANIMPGDLIKVELKYTELLIPTESVYEFVYPTVVGPRFSDTPEEGAPDTDKWVKNPYMREGEASPYEFDIKVNLTSGIPIQDVHSDSHNVNVNFTGKEQARVKLAASEKSGGNRDFILNYRLAGGKVQSGMMLFEGENENFFLLMTEPPKRVKNAEIPPREYIFVVDVSGSMRGFPLNISKALLRKLIGDLKPTDTFNVLLFAGRSKLMSEKSLPATEANITKAIDVIDRQQGGGGTQLLQALNRAIALPKEEDAARSIVVVTDGYVHVELETFDAIRKNLGNANLFSFGIGSSVNRFLIEGMARMGLGEPFIITKPEGAKAIATKFRKYIQTPVLANVKVDFGDFEAYDIEPPAIPDVLAERPVVVFGKWKGSPRGTVTLSGSTGSGKYSKSIDVSALEPKDTNSALRYLWARKRIEVLADYNKLQASDERVKEVTTLGLTYNLLTAYTSFVAIDSEVRNKGGESTTVKQPLPLPEGVSDAAIGAPTKYRALASTSPRIKGRRYPKSESLGIGSLFDTRKEATVQSADVEEKKPTAKYKVVENKLEVSGGMSKAEVLEVLKKQLSALNSCVKVGSRGTGEVVLKLVIDASGNVFTAEAITGGSLRNKTLENCLQEQVKKWRFSRKGTPTTIKLVLKIS